MKGSHLCQSGTIINDQSYLGTYEVERRMDAMQVEGHMPGMALGTNKIRDQLGSLLLPLCCSLGEEAVTFILVLIFHSSHTAAGPRPPFVNP